MIVPSYFKASICHFQLMQYLHFLLPEVNDFNYEEVDYEISYFLCIILIIDLLRFGQEGIYEFAGFYFLECLFCHSHL